MGSTSVLELEDSSYSEHFKRGGNFAVWKDQNIWVALIVDYSWEKDKWEVDKIRFTTNKSELVSKRGEFERLFDRCQDTVDLFSYIYDLSQLDRAQESDSASPLVAEET